jgi:PPP family 3-phenylpropionic acid transporter
VLSGIWLFGLGGFGFFLPFYTLYLRENAGLSGTQIGLVMAVVPGVGALTQWSWGYVADLTGRRKQVLAAIAFGTAGSYLLLSQQTTFEGFLFGTATLALFQVALVPMCMSVSFAVLDERSGERLGRTRMWGTLGFAVCVLGLPLALRAWGSAPPIPGVSEPQLGWLFPGAALWLATAGLLALRLPEVGSVRARAQRGEWRALLRDRVYRRVLLFTFLCYLSLQGPMHMFPLLVRGHGGGVEAISRLWFWMLLLEVPLVFWFGRTVGRIGPRGVIAIGMAAASVRWLVSGYSEDLGPLVTAVQVLHGVTVWGVMLGLPFYVEKRIPAQLLSTGLAGMAIAGVSLGAVVSNSLAGWLVDAIGPAAPARVGGTLAAFCVLLIPWLLPSLKQEVGKSL